MTVARDAESSAVSASGELDLGSVDELTSAVHRLWESGCRRVVVDLEGLEFIDSSGLRGLIQLREAAMRDGHRFALVRGRPPVQRIFDLTGTDVLFDWRAA